MNAFNNFFVTLCMHTSVSTCMVLFFNDLYQFRYQFFKALKICAFCKDFPLFSPIGRPAIIQKRSVAAPYHRNDMR